MSVSVDEERAEARRRQRQVAEELKASGALDGIFAQMDAGTPLTGDDGLLSGVVKAALERGLETELSEHLGYDKGDPDAAAYPNSRNGTSPKTIGTDVKPWVLWRVFYLEPVVAGWGSSIVWLVLWLSAWSVSSGGGV